MLRRAADLCRHHLGHKIALANTSARAIPRRLHCRLGEPRRAAHDLQLCRTFHQPLPVYQQIGIDEAGVRKP